MMKFRPLFQPKYRLLKLPHIVHFELHFAVGVGFRDSAWRQRRFLGTAAAREVPDDGVGRSRKRVSKEERKSMVEAYVEKYRMENGGKFPTPSDTKKQVGGCYYVVRGILQELQYNSNLPTVETKDKVVGQQSDKVDGISPLSSKDTNVVSGVGEVLNSEVLVEANVSNEYDISSDNSLGCQREVSNDSGERMVNMSTFTQKNEMLAEDDRSVVGYTAKHEEISEIGKVSDSEVLVDTTIVSESYTISTDGGTSCEDESRKNGDERVMDMSVGSHCNEISNEAEYPTGGQTGKIDEISGVLDSEMMAGTTSVSGNIHRISADDGFSSQGKMSTTCEDSTVDRTDKTNETSEVKGGFESNMVVSKGIGSDDNGIQADKGSNSQGETSNDSSQTMIDTSKVTNYNEVSAKDESSIAGQTFKAEGISEENSGSSSKLGHPSQDPGESRNTDFGKSEEASLQASEPDQSTRERTKNEQQETSLWGNLKSFASSIVSIWRK